MLSQEQIDSYHENGYLTVENVLSADELDALQRVTDEFIDRSRLVSEHNDVFDLEPNHSPQNPRLRRIKDPINQHEVYDQTLRHDGILDIVEQLIGKGVRCNGNKLNMKAKAHGAAVEWHQDWAFYPHTNDDLMAVGVAIDAMTEENGCMLMVPGSHKTELTSHHENGVFVGAVADPDFNPQRVEKCLVGAGGISLHHVRTLHASAPNHSTNPRRLLLLQYCSLDSWPPAWLAQLRRLSRHGTARRTCHATANGSRAGDHPRAEAGERRVHLRDSRGFARTRDGQAIDLPWRRRTH